MSTAIFSFAAASMFAAAAAADSGPDGANWPRFRGPNGSGVSLTQQLPGQIGPETNLAWKVDTGKGLSSPIVANGRIYLTAAGEEQRILEARDAKTGERLWQLEMPRLRETTFTPPNGPATATPVVDGDQVFAFFADAGLIAATTAGEELWRLPVAPADSMHGLSSSLVVADDKVILLADQLGSSFIAAFACATGHEAWRKDRFNGFTGGFSTPAIYEPSGGLPQLLVFGPLELVAYEANSGERLWWVTGMGNGPIASPVLAGERVIVSEPVFEPLPYSILAGMDRDQDGTISAAESDGSSMKRFIEKIDRENGDNDGALTEGEWDQAQAAIKGKGGLASVQLGGHSDVSATNIAWTYRKQVPYIPSTLLYESLLYMVQDGGLVTTLDPETGEVVKRGRLTQGGGQFWASPVAADGKIFLINTLGQITVLTAGRDWAELSFGELGELAWATPAIADGRIYVRTETHLWCFQQ